MIFQEPGYERRYKKLTAQQRARVDSSLARLAEVFGRPHLHAGLGIRPYGPYLEMRAGLDLRVLFFADEGDLFLVCVGNHDELRRYIKNR
jgi:hypothetical protein